MTKLTRTSLALVLASTIVGCGTDPLPVGPAAELIPDDPVTARPVVVEPTNKRTFAANTATPAGTEFFIKVLAKASTDEILLYRCGTPCNTASRMMRWAPGAYRVGDELRWSANESARYYIWSRDMQNDRASVVVAQERVGKRLRMTFDSGAVYEAWYVTP